MNRKLLKRYKRQVARAKERVKVSEPDVRTPEQLAAAREASSAVSRLRNEPHANYWRLPPRLRQTVKTQFAVR